MGRGVLHTPTVLWCHASSQKARADTNRPYESRRLRAHPENATGTQRDVVHDNSEEVDLGFEKYGDLADLTHHRRIGALPDLSR